MAAQDQTARPRAGAKFVAHAQAAAIAVDDTLTGIASGIVVFLYLAVVAAMTQLVTLSQAGSLTLLFVMMVSSGVIALALGVAGVLSTRL